MIFGSKFHPLSRILVLAFGIAFLGGCDKSADGGTNDETATIAFYLPDGRPAAGARARFYAASDTGSLPRSQAVLGADGSLALPDLPAGYYNVVVRDDAGLATFQDSLYSDGDTMDCRSDTLHATGAVVGRIRVQPQDDPKIAWVSLLGAGRNVNVDDSGYFRFEGVPAGTHSLVALTDRPEYTRTFRATRVRSDSISDLGDIQLVYTGLPLATGLGLEWDSLGGIVRLHWSAATSNKVAGWRIRRGRSEYPSGAEVVGLVNVATLTFSDTLVGAKGLFGVTDTIGGSVYYWVESLDQLGVPGSPWERVGLDFRPPRLVDVRRPAWVAVGALGLWNDGEARRFDTLDGGFVASEVRWNGSSSEEERVAVSSDGVAWSVVAQRAFAWGRARGMADGISFAGRFWWVEYAGDSGQATIRNGGEVTRWDTVVVRGMDHEGGIVEYRSALHDSAQYAHLATDGRELTLLHVGGDNMAYLRNLVRRRERWEGGGIWRDDAAAAAWIPDEQSATSTTSVFPSSFGSPWIQAPDASGVFFTSWSLGRAPGGATSEHVLDLREIGGRIVVREGPQGATTGDLFWADSSSPALRHKVVAPGKVAGMTSRGGRLWILVGDVVYRADDPLGN